MGKGSHYWHYWGSLEIPPTQLSKVKATLLHQLGHPTLAPPAVRIGMWHVASFEPCLCQRAIACHCQPNVVIYIYIYTFQKEKLAYIYHQFHLQQSICDFQNVDLLQTSGRTIRTTPVAPKRSQSSEASNWELLPLPNATDKLRTTSRTEKKHIFHVTLWSQSKKAK